MTFSLILRVQFNQIVRLKTMFSLIWGYFGTEFYSQKQQNHKLNRSLPKNTQTSKHLRRPICYDAITVQPGLHVNPLQPVAQAGQDLIGDGMACMGKLGGVNVLSGYRICPKDDCFHARLRLGNMSYIRKQLIHTDPSDDGGFLTVDKNIGRSIFIQISGDAIGIANGDDGDLHRGWGSIGPAVAQRISGVQMKDAGNPRFDRHGRNQVKIFWGAAFGDGPGLVVGFRPGLPADVFLWTAVYTIQGNADAGIVILELAVIKNAIAALDMGLKVFEAMAVKIGDHLIKAVKLLHGETVIIRFRAVGSA